MAIDAPSTSLSVIAAPALDLKQCASCHTEKPVSKFEGGLRSGNLRQKCRDCRSSARSTESVRASTAKRGKTPGAAFHQRKKRLRKQYGITPSCYDQMLAAQNNSCAICKITAENYSIGSLCVDHDHDTGQVRGLLCHKCNTCVALMGDNKANVDAYYLSVTAYFSNLADL
jgi:hypothetical protein